MSETVFKKVDYGLSLLVDNIDIGEIGLPDLQRPFVWDDVKVRNLFDSMYRGFPVGHLLLWESGAETGAKQIGGGAKQLVPKILIVDGQQRLTSLFAVMKQREVIGKDYKPRRIQIAFRPSDGTFAVANPATRLDPTFLDDIGDMWTKPSFQVITEFLAQLRNGSEITPAEEAGIAAALGKLESLKTYPFTALVLGANIDDESVAEVFVRINSEGKNLNQADFILTLMSVHWDAGRAALEQWTREAKSPGDPAANPYLAPDPDQLLRVAIALGFRRGRLEDAYPVLRGRDPATGKISEALRTEQFERLERAQAKVLDKSVWQDFLQCVRRAGHRSSGTISSKTAILYSYALFLIGKHDYGVPPKQLREVIARWFFMSSLTSRYSSGGETTIAADMASLPAEADAESFIKRLDEVISQRLTNDYWEITLPAELATSGSNAPTLYGYLAALNILDAQVLFSKVRVSELSDPALAGGKAKVQRHHLFPRKHLEGLGVVDLTKVNQIANLAVLEWHDNLAISAADPEVYWPAYLGALREPPVGMAQFTESEVADMLRWHALAEDWPQMPYEEFLADRRRRMAAVVRSAFERLAQGAVELPAMDAWPPSPAALEHLLHAGESSRVEMKSSLRADTLEKEIPHKVIEKIAARTVAGFLNAQGGLLVIGVNDDGQPLGLDRDLATFTKQDIDVWEQALVNVLSSYLGTDVASKVRIHLTKVGPSGHDVALVDCQPSSKPVFLSDGANKEFHIRFGNTTRLLDIQEATMYIAEHWKGSV